MGIMGWLFLLAGIWGFAEATFFFIIPDVLLTFIAMHGLKRGGTACVTALVGALLGGSVVYLLAVQDFDNISSWIAAVPGISGSMLAQVKTSLQAQGVFAMIIGPMKGIPYKTFALMAPGEGVSLAVFILASIPARFIRFIATSVLAWWLSEKLFDRVPMWIKYIIWLFVWITVYSIYFSIHPW